MEAPNPHQFFNWRSAVEARMESILPSPETEPTKLHQAMRHSALAPGKRLRPLLCLASAGAVGGVEEDVLDGAVSLELIHCFSLIHDDLPAIDNDDLRRGLPTCHVAFGEAIAILAGDALFALAFDVLSRSRTHPDRSAWAISVLAKATGSPGLVAGEVLDILSENLPPDRDLVERIHRWKTGSLISASCQLGGILAGATDAQVASLGEFGMKIGLAFQVQDDILNEVSTLEDLGKAAGSDRDRGKQTYPSVMGLEASRELAEVLAKEAEEALASLPGDASPLADLGSFSVFRRS